jgi:TRAP-type C4-dicarboxylate transport system permease small subunit
LIPHIRALYGALAVASGYALVGLSLFIFIEIVARKLFNYSFQGVDELGGYILAVVAAVGFGYALLERAHTRIDVLLVRLPTGPRAILNVVAALAIAAFASFMAWRAVAVLNETIEFQSLASTPWQTPLWIPQSLWVAGLIGFAIVAVVLFARSVILLARDPAKQDREVGVPGLHEQIDEEMGPRPANGGDGGR